MQSTPDWITVVNAVVPLVRVMFLALGAVTLWGIKEWFKQHAAEHKEATQKLIDHDIRMARLETAHNAAYGDMHLDGYGHAGE